MYSDNTWWTVHHGKNASQKTPGLLLYLVQLYKAPSEVSWQLSQLPFIPFAASCKDVGWFCWFYTSSEICHKSSNYAVNKCKKTCNFCPVTTGR